LLPSALAGDPPGGLATKPRGVGGRGSAWQLATRFFAGTNRRTSARLSKNFSKADCVGTGARCIPIDEEVARRGIKLRRAGAELIGPCPTCGGSDRFGVNVRKQIWNCRQCGVGGDVIKLAQHLDGSDFKDAIETLVGNTACAAPRAKPTSAKRNNGNDKQRASKAAWLWSQRKPISEGTPPALYLRKRGYTGLIPAMLGYLPARDSHLASMIAAFGVTEEPEPGTLAAPKTVAGVHLTRLTTDGSKAPNADGKSKIMVGTCKGLPIVISPPNDLLGMAVTEGIEDALSVYQATGLGVWAAGAAGFMPALAPLIPNYIEAVTIYAHDDQAGQRGALDLARALNARGVDVFVDGVAR
jgi:putative DNA primase/helicase